MDRRQSVGVENCARSPDSRSGRSCTSCRGSVRICGGGASGETGTRPENVRATPGPTGVTTPLLSMLPRESPWCDVCSVDRGSDKRASGSCCRGCRRCGSGPSSRSMGGRGGHLIPSTWRQSSKLHVMGGREDGLAFVPVPPEQFPDGAAPSARGRELAAADRRQLRSRAGRGCTVLPRVTPCSCAGVPPGRDRRSVRHAGGARAAPAGRGACRRSAVGGECSGPSKALLPAA